MSEADILAAAPEVEGYTRWRATGKHVIYENGGGEVDMVYDLTTGETKQMPEYPICTPENFRNCDILVADVIENGNYFLWLQEQAKSISCSANMRTDVPMTDYYGRYITPNYQTAPNFRVPGSEFFVRDYTSGIIRFPFEDKEWNYVMLPLFMCTKDGTYPIMLVLSPFNRLSVEKQEKYFNYSNGNGLDGSIALWRKTMKITLITTGTSSPFTPNFSDPLVEFSFKLHPEMDKRFARFVSGDYSALSHESILLLTVAAENYAGHYR